MSVIKLKAAIARLRRPDPNTPRGIRTVQVKDLEYVLDEYDRVATLVDQDFLSTGEWTKMIANESMPAGWICMANTEGKVLFVGPLPEMPSPDANAVPTRMVVNLHPNTLAAIAWATEKKQP